MPGPLDFLKWPRHAMAEAPSHRVSARQPKFHEAACLRHAAEGELIAAIFRTAINQMRQGKAVASIDVSDLLHGGALVGPTSDPVDPVMPAAHASATID